MSQFNKFNCFVEDLAEKAHDLQNDVIKVALTNTVPVATNSVLADLTLVDTTYADNLAVNVTSSGQTDGTYKLVLEDKSITADGGTVGPFRYMVLYNETSTGDKLIGWADKGTSITLYDGDEYLIYFDQENGALTIA